MISQTPEQRLLYNSRLKFQRDEAARLQKAREDGIPEGEARGEARGEKHGRIRILQEMLELHPFTQEEFSGFDDLQLAELEEQLRQQFRSRIP